MKNDDGVAIGAAMMTILIILANLAWIGALIWGLYELVTWLTSQTI